MKGLSISREAADAHNARVKAEEQLFAQMTPEERRRHMQAKAGKREMPPEPVHIPRPTSKDMFGPDYKPAPKAPPKPREMNDTERAYSVILEDQKQRGLILSWRYEGMRLKWGGCMSYKPDFVVFREIGEQRVIEMHETKGPHIFDRDIVRFKGCRAEWPEFDFIMMQLINREWIRKY